MATPIIQNGERPKPPAIQQCVRDKIHAPLLIQLCWAWRDHTQVTRVLPSPLELHRQSFFPIDPMDALFIHPPPFTPEQDMQPQIAKARTRLGQFLHPHPNRRVVSPMGPVIPRGPIQLEEPTRAPHPDRKVAQHLPHERALAQGLQAFFASTSCKITLSKVRSATSCLSFRFSSSS